MGRKSGFSDGGGRGGFGCGMWGRDRKQFYRSQTGKFAVLINSAIKFVVTVESL